MSRLRSRELCPLHHSFWCPCHKQALQAAKPLRVGGPNYRPAVELIEDPHHPRGYREVCSSRELRRRKHVLMEREPVCFYCFIRFTAYSEIELAHKEPKGLGGSCHDDSMENLVLAHRKCNFLNGSKHASAEVAHEL